MRTASVAVGLTLVALAMTASPASAQVDVELTEGGNHCGAVSVTNHVVSGGCELKAVGDGDWTITFHLFGFETTVMQNCTVDFEMNFDEDGHGYISELAFSGAGECSEVALEQEAGGGVIPWEIEISEEGAPDHKLNMYIDFELIHDEIPIVGNNVYSLLSEHTCCIRIEDQPIGGGYELDAGWLLNRHNDQGAMDHIGVTHL